MLLRNFILSIEMKLATPDITIIIATFNSAKLLGRVLDAVKVQDFPQESIEVLIIDGGSADETIALASAYGCVVIKNPETEPVNAKFLGFKNSKGRYLVFLDHDEVMQDKGSLSRKRVIFDQNPEVHAVIGSGYINPDPKNIVNEYINEFGDPFSFFIYRLSKGSRYFIKSLRQRYKIEQENDSSLIVDFSIGSRLPIIELVALGSMIDKDYFIKQFPEVLHDKSLIGHLFYHLVERAPYVGVTKSDPLVHYSSENIKKYLAKIRWRVKNNVHFSSGTGAAGFTGRQQFDSLWGKYRKYFFPIYTFTIVLPLIDAIQLAISRKQPRYLIHVPLTIYTASYVLFQLALRLVGYRPQQKSYDESKVIKSQ
jgi:glycosyltransferase involved in cell wall biosynthesis